MPHVSALYRYPVKGFTPEKQDALIVQSDGRVAGDRVLAFRFTGDVEPREREGLDYWAKSRGLALMDFPSLARLRLHFDAEAVRLRIHDGATVVVEAGLDDDGRREIEEAVTALVAASADARRLEGEGVLPLRLVGDGRTSRFQDRPRGFVSLHGSASVDELDAAVPAPIDDRRFRSNIVVSGTAPWEELGWSGRLRIGEASFDIQFPIERCAAILANPDTGVRDARLLRLLSTEFGQEEPTLGILLLPSDGRALIRLGDEIAPDRA